ncbi:FAD-dependent monooxygenase [uncultured Ilumatobacter sp.]|uniref:FAD-dependent monooxygenase n=1 Tax=uncultured Ilumatobacter sp. TaxID=879968 RepID=UPI00374E631B
MRAGILEWGSVEVLRAAGLDGRMDLDGHVHDGAALVWGGREPFFVDINRHVGSHFMSYGQTNIQEDLYVAADLRDAALIFEAADVEVHEPLSDRPHITFEVGGVTERIDAAGAEQHGTISKIRGDNLDSGQPAGSAFDRRNDGFWHSVQWRANVQS